MTLASTWSERLWGIDWDSLTPWTFDSGIECRRVGYDDCVAFIKENYRRVFAGASDSFFSDSSAEAKLRFCRDSDVFLFTEGDATMGVCVAHPLDWSSYYLRTFAILPEYQDRRAGTEWVLRVSDVLERHGVSRFEMDTAPANHRVIHVLNQLGLMVTGTSHTERWGTLIRYTKILNDEAKRDFVRRFCMGGWDDPRHSISGTVSKTHERRTP